MACVQTVPCEEAEILMYHKWCGGGNESTSCSFIPFRDICPLFPRTCISLNNPTLSESACVNLSLSLLIEKVPSRHPEEQVKREEDRVPYFILWGPISKLLVHISIIALKYRLDYTCLFVCLSCYLHVLFIFASTALIIVPRALVGTPKTLLNWTEEGTLKNSWRLNSVGGRVG